MSRVYGDENGRGRALRISSELMQTRQVIRTWAAEEEGKGANSWR